MQQHDLTIKKNSPVLKMYVSANYSNTYSCRIYVPLLKRVTLRKINIFHSVVQHTAVSAEWLKLSKPVMCISQVKYWDPLYFTINVDIRFVNMLEGLSTIQISLLYVSLCGLKQDKHFLCRKKTHPNVQRLGKRKDNLFWVSW